MPLEPSHLQKVGKIGTTFLLLLPVNSTGPLYRSTATSSVCGRSFLISTPSFHTTSLIVLVALFRSQLQLLQSIERWCLQIRHALLVKQTVLLLYSFNFLIMLGDFRYILAILAVWQVGVFRFNFNGRIKLVLFRTSFSRGTQLYKSFLFI